MCLLPVIPSPNPAFVEYHIAANTHALGYWIIDTICLGPFRIANKHASFAAVIELAKLSEPPGIGHTAKNLRWLTVGARPFHAS
jgi:hypothetical protein